jgi:hypothetical protein
MNTQLIEIDTSEMTKISGGYSFWDYAITMALDWTVGNVLEAGKEGWLAYRAWAQATPVTEAELRRTLPGAI